MPKTSIFPTIFHRFFSTISLTKRMSDASDKAQAAERPPSFLSGLVYPVASPDGRTSSADPGPFGVTEGANFLEVEGNASVVVQGDHQVMLTDVTLKAPQAAKLSPADHSKRKSLKASAYLGSVAMAGLCGAAGAKIVPTQPTVKRGWAIANGKSLRFELSGSGDTTLVLLHEIGMCLETWDEVLPLLGPGKQMLRYDLRGFGLSEKISEATTFDDEIADLRALLDALGITRPVVLVGSSLGGAISLQFAAAFPDRVKSVVALSPATGVSQAGRPAMLAVADRLEKMTMHNWLLGTIDGAFAGGVSTPDRLSRFKAMQLASEPSNCAAMVRMIALADFSSVFARVKAPTLIVGATLDKGRSVESMREVAGLIAGARFTSLASGHFMPIQVPVELARLLNDFLSKS